MGASQCKGTELLKECELRICCAESASCVRSRGQAASSLESTYVGDEGRLSSLRYSQLRCSVLKAWHAKHFIS